MELLQMDKEKREPIKDLSSFKKEGVVFGRITNIVRSLTFETPIKTVDVGMLGHEQIGAFSYIGPGSEIKNAKIGRYCSIARNVAISPPEHPVDWVSSHPFQYNGLNWFNENENWENVAGNCVWKGNSEITEIGNDVWIGRNVVIRKGVKIGDGAIVAANSFVNKDVEPYSVVGGQPARHLKFRHDCAIRQKLIELKWWDWIVPNPEKLSFDNPELFIKQFNELKEKGELKPLNPTQYKIEKDGAEYYSRKVQ